MSGRAWGTAVVTVALIAVVAWYGWPSAPESESVGAARRLPVAEEGSLPDSGERIARIRQRDADELRNRRPQAEAPVEQPAADAFMPTWEAVDMDAVRAAMPDNVYWEMSAPTDDPAVLERRSAERERWNLEYGKVLSGTGTEQDVRDYYDRRARMFGDYVEFTTYLIENYENVLPERDLGLLMLARRLNQARLEEVPREVEDALQRTRAQIAAREAWQRDRDLFEERREADAAGDAQD